MARQPEIPDDPHNFRFTTFMSIQEKIDQLALAVLRSAPSSTCRPQPATFMLPFEKPKRLAIVASSGDFLDARYPTPSRAPREVALAGAASPWPFCAREVWL
jgi:hypothetical protein